MADKLMIFAVCLMSSQKYTADAVYDGERLIIAKVSPIAGNFLTWKGKLIKEIEDRKARGFVVIVEEKTDYISQYGTQYLLEDMNDDDLNGKRSNYCDALDWYFALYDINNLVFHPDCVKYEIRETEGGFVDRASNDKGQSIYKVDWRRFHGGYRAVLLCVVAALNEPLSERYLEAMFEADARANETANPALNFKGVIHRFAVQQGREIQERREKLP